MEWLLPDRQRSSYWRSIDLCRTFSAQKSPLLEQTQQRCSWHPLASRMVCQHMQAVRCDPYQGRCSDSDRGCRRCTPRRPDKCWEPCRVRNRPIPRISPITLNRAGQALRGENLRIFARISKERHLSRGPSSAGHEFWYLARLVGGS